MKNAKSQVKRTRNWTFVLYPESAPSNWLQQLEELHMQILISPLHDKDISADGSLKKAHYHIVLLFDSVKTFEQIKEICDKLNCPIPQICQSVKGMARYLTHMDDPNKYQYNKSDIITIGGVDLADLLKPTSRDRYMLIKEMIDFINFNQVTEFEDIIDYAMNKKFDTWFPLLCDNSSYIIKSVIQSKRNRLKDDRVMKYEGDLVNVDTGEIKTELGYLKKE